MYDRKFKSSKTERWKTNEPHHKNARPYNRSKEKFNAKALYEN